MKRIQITLIVMFLALVLSACGAEGLYRFTLVTDGTHTIENDLSGDLILTGGEVALPADVLLDGSVHMLSGSLQVEGEITGDISFLNGDLRLGPTARVGGTLNLGGGSYHPSPGAVIVRGTNTGTGIALPDLPERSAPSLWDVLLRTLINGIFLGSVAALLSRFAPKVLERVGDAAMHHSMVSGAIGLLVGVVGLSLLVTMAYTILLIPVTLLGLFLLGVGVLYGWIALGVWAGRLAVRVLKRPVQPSVQAFLSMFVFMLVLELLSLIPTIGSLLAIAISVVGLGAVSLTRFGIRRFIPANPENLST